MSSLLLGPQCCCECCAGFTYDQDGCNFTFYGNSSCNGIEVVSWKWEEIKYQDPEDEWEEFSTEQNPEEIVFEMDQVSIGNLQLYTRRLIRLTETLLDGRVCTYTNIIYCECLWDYREAEDLRAFGNYVQSLSAIQINLLPGDFASVGIPLGNKCTQPYNCDVIAGQWTIPYLLSNASGPDYFEIRFQYTTITQEGVDPICGEPLFPHGPDYGISVTWNVTVIVHTGLFGTAGVNITVDLTVTFPSTHIYAPEFLPQNRRNTNIVGRWANNAESSCIGDADLSMPLYPVDQTQFEQDTSLPFGRECITVDGGRPINLRYIP